MGSKRRLLRLVECTKIHLGINFMVSFRADLLERKHFLEAVSLTLKKYPYLRMKIVKDSENRLEFVERNDDDDDGKIVIWKCAEDISFMDWQNRFNQFSSVHYDISKCVFYIEVYDFMNSNYQFYFSINHSGCDTLSTVAILKDLFKYLDATLSSSKNVDPVVSKQFLDIHNNLKSPFSIDELRQERPYECEFQAYISKLVRRETSQNNIDIFRLPYVSLFKELDEHLSRSLLDNCKRNAATVQGVLCVARAVWLIHEKLDLSKVASKSIEYLDNVIMDNRNLFNLENEDVFNGAATVSWTQTLETNNQDLWKLAMKTSNDIKRFKLDSSGLKLWIKLENSIRPNMVRSFAGTFGVLSLNEAELTHLQIDDLRFMLSMSPSKFDPNLDNVVDNCTNVFAHTYMNRLRLAFQCSYPSLSLDWGQAFANNYYEIIKCFCECQTNLPLQTVITRLKRFDN